MTNLTTSEYAVWNIFLAISSFVTLFDFGYGVVIQRYVMYSYSGADRIDSEIIPEIKNNSKPNYKLFYQIIIASSKIYGNISKISGVVLILLTPYILIISKDQFSAFQILVPWIVFSISTVINMRILSNATIIKGLGLIGELQKITLNNSLFSTIIKGISLQLGLGIFGLSISFLLTSLLLAYQYSKIVSIEKRKDLNLYTEVLKTFNNDFIDSYRVIKEKSRGIAGVLISNFLQNQLFTIIAPLFLSLELMGRYGLTWQIINIIASLSSITFSTYTMRMGNYLVSNRKQELKRTFSVTISMFFVTYGVGSLVVLLFGEELLNIVGSNTQLLDISEILLIIMYVCIIQLNQKSTNIISLTNNQEYVKSLMLSSLLIAILNVAALYFGFGITTVLLNGIIIHSAYNLWRWGLEAMTLCEVQFSDFIVQPYKKLKIYFKN